VLALLLGAEHDRGVVELAELSGCPVQRRVERAREQRDIAGPLAAHALSLFGEDPGSNGTGK
jgi:hypothetical protein